MIKDCVTSADIRKIYRLNERGKTVQSLYNSEKRGDIPYAKRVSRGNISVRHWRYSDLPIIGEKFGFIKKPNNQIVISKYIQKGGVLKTTTTFNEAVIFALNGLKTLVIGQDFEKSITDILLPPGEIKDISQLQNRLGLYHFLVEKAPIDEVIYHTNLPTLDIIPETHDLIVLNKWIDQQKRREYIYKDRLMPYLKNYDVIIFDHNPGWSFLNENSMVVSDAVMAPLGCNLLAYNASETNIGAIFEFQESMKIPHQEIILFPTLLENNTLSKQAYSHYLARYSDFIITTAIRSSVKFQEAIVLGQTILEYAPSSPAARDYYDLITDIWERLLNTKKGN